MTGNGNFERSEAKYTHIVKQRKAEDMLLRIGT